jgi:SAM-dependent methyltransferase
VSEQDREKWNARYREGAYAEREHPSRLLERWAPLIRAEQQSATSGRVLRALDIACGAGRNALWLAVSGFRVDAIDIAEAGLDRARASAEARGLAVDWHCLDLEAGLPKAYDGYDLIAVFRYLQRDLLGELPSRLRPGGYLVCEVHMATDAEVVGPTSAAFRVAPGELGRLMRGLEILELEEGIFDDPDGRPVAVARLVGRRGP